MGIEITIPGRCVPAVRMTQRSKYTKQAQRYLSYKRSVGIVARHMYKGDLINSKLAVNLKVYLSGGNQGDIDNYFKSITDACNKIIYKDDRQIIKAEMQKIECEKKDERVEVEFIYLGG